MRAKYNPTAETNLDLAYQALPPRPESCNVINNRRVNVLFLLNEKVAPNFSESRLRYDCIIRCAGFTEEGGGEGGGGGLEITRPGINHTRIR